MLLVGNTMDEIKEVKKQFSSKFDMKDLGAMNSIRGFCDFESKKWVSKQKKCTIKINFTRTNHILEDDIIPRDELTLFELKMFSCHILNG
jgi:hypothetical protein